MDFLIKISLATVVLTGCASSVPTKISYPPPNNPSVAEVRTNLKKHLGSKVRWGGVIAGVQNLESETLVEVVAQKLELDGRPKTYSNSAGRFQARIDTFLDPVIYEKGRQFTVMGTVEGEQLVVSAETSGTLDGVVLESDMTLQRRAAVTVLNGSPLPRRPSGVAQ